MFSPQAQWGKQWLDNHPEITQDLHLDITYLVEIIYKENKVVISYPFEGLVLLGAYDIVSGYEVSYSILRQFSQNHPAIRIADIHEFKSFNDAAEYVKTLPGNREGFVIHFPETGDRLKIKGDEYKTLHKMISSISPLAV
jgi:RNA ligase